MLSLFCIFRKRFGIQKLLNTEYLNFIHTFLIVDTFLNKKPLTTLGIYSGRFGWICYTIGYEEKKIFEINIFGVLFSVRVCSCILRKYIFIQIYWVAEYCNFTHTHFECNHTFFKNNDTSTFNNYYGCLNS